MMFCLSLNRAFPRLIVSLLLVSSVWSSHAAETLRLGISSFAEHSINKVLIDPTIKAIRDAVQPDKLEVEYLELNRLQNSLKNGQLDLVLSSAGNYRRFLLEGYGLRDLATMVSTQAPNPNYAEGSVCALGMSELYRVKVPKCGRWRQAHSQRQGLNREVPTEGSPRQTIDLTNRNGLRHMLSGKTA